MKEKIKLEELRGIIPFKWRVQSSYPKNAPKTSIMIPYIDARDVAEKLDLVCGIGNWTDEYYSINGKTYCKIGIRVDGEWVYKSDVGTESNTEKEKGEASDAFKRAAVKWGINRDAYRLGVVKIPCKEYSGKYYPCDENGKFLKGQALYDYCNSKAKIEDMDNYSVPEASKGSKIGELL